MAAKNETKNISGLINSLKCLDYSPGNFEVIIVDDESADNTFETATLAACGLSNFRIYKSKDKIFPAKKGALDLGINLASNQFILITDADCLPSKKWLKSYSEKFDEGYDFIFGAAPFIQTNSLVNKISCFENLRSSLLFFSAANLNIPYSAAARNFGFRKSSFQKIKGYSNTTETLSGDDDLLIREAVKNKLKIGTIYGGQTYVSSFTKNTFKEYLKQKSRHTKTSLYYLPMHKLLLGFWHIMNLCFVFSPLLVFYNSFFFIPFIFKIFVDVLIVLINQKNFNYRFRVIEIIYLQVFYEIFLIVNFINANIQKDTW
ncbi:MAG: glycosyltransferase [Bacteroidetes bacterium]|nr:glycosyltransferase [Bacteroidota bacterium]